MHVSNKELTEAIIECQTSEKSPNIVSDKLGRMLILLVTRYAESANWALYSYKSEMIADALTHLCCGGGAKAVPPVLRFDSEYAKKKAARDGTTPLQPNGFAFVTQICYHSFLRTLNLQKRQAYILDELRLAGGIDCSNARHIENIEEQRAPGYTAKKPAKPAAKTGRPRKPSVRAGSKRR